MSNENEPRVPAGQPGGGQWTDQFGGVHQRVDSPKTAALRQRVESLKQQGVASDAKLSQLKRETAMHEQRLREIQSRPDPHGHLKSEIQTVKQKIADTNASSEKMLRQSRRDN